MTYPRAREIIWLPDEHELAEVAEAALVVLEQRAAPSEDAHQASYLLSTFRPRGGPKT